MSRSLSPELRLAVAQRAANVCEYCLIHQEDTYFGCEVDHIVSVKHGGDTSLENLAYACLPCNRHKGSDVATLLGSKIVPLYNPRRDIWRDHFHLNGVRIEGKTEIGEATVRLLSLNDPSRLIERESLRTIGRYPSASATKLAGVF